MEYVVHFYQGKFLQADGEGEQFADRAVAEDFLRQKVRAGDDQHGAGWVTELREGAIEVEVYRYDPHGMLQPLI